MTRSRKFLPIVCLVAFVALAACESSEEKAEKHFQSGVTLLEGGDVERAVLEFRNAIRLNRAHLDARKTLARTYMDAGRLAEAYRQYGQISELEPSNLEARQTIAELAIEAGNWEDAERHGSKAIELAPDEPRIKAIDAVLRYRAAIEREDNSARREAADFAELVSEDLEDKLIAKKVVIDNMFRDLDYSGALQELDLLIADGVTTAEILELRLIALNLLGDDAGAEAQLKDLVQRFPEDDSFKQGLVQWFLSRGDLDQAEAFFRSEVEGADDVDAAQVTLIDFLRQMRGVDAAKAALRGILESTDNRPLFSSLLASFEFEEGNQEEAIQTLENIVETEETSEQVRGIKVALAQMYLATGDQVRARQLVEEVLTEDPSNTEAMKMRASWQIEDDRADDAILTLRAALDLAPRDSEIMTIMAEAHIRNGDRSLATEVLSLAVEASRNAPEETLRYARFLSGDRDFRSAESTLISGLRRVPNHIELLSELGAVYIALEDWPRTEQVERNLRRLEDEGATAVADQIALTRLQRQERIDEAITFLEDLSEREGASAAAAVEIVRYHINSGDLDEATAFIDRVLSEEPDNRAMRFFQAAVFALTDRGAAAERIYRRLVQEDPTDIVVWRSLYSSMLVREDIPAATAVLSEALEANPKDPSLLWLKASELERDRDIDGAIAIYEELYAADSSSAVIANNLASLITAYREDEESLSRAFTIARRLRGSEVPAFQDTYGWIALRRGDALGAIRYLEPAAEGLPGDALVQYHLAVAYATAQRHAQALKQFRIALEVAGPDDPRPQFDAARAEVERLESIVGE